MNPPARLGLRALAALIATLFAQPNAHAKEPLTNPSLSYNRDIRPILSDACFHCHGPDEKERKAGLRLDLRDTALKPAKSGAIAIIPGDPQKSELIQRLTTEDPDELMPPPKTHKKLSQKQRELLRDWILQGAPYQKHWAFVPLSPVTPPSVQKTPWIRNPVDQFILKRLEKEGLAPAPEAQKETLLRRLSLDLTGLPPSPAELDTFLADSSPSAYESAVDRLLASPHFGERMAVDWLDAARFADTNGYQVDRNRELWAWRDWVIEAFNRNLPFDQFTIEQLAGDLLPNPTLQQRIATGFHRNHMINEEGGVIADEFLAEYTADRVETTASVWLAQTFNCARCHDHKYDPFTQRDFYSLKAFFHNITEKGIGNYGATFRLSSPPLIKLPTLEQQTKLQSLQNEITQTENQLKALAQSAAPEIAAWVNSLATDSVRWSPIEIALPNPLNSKTAKLAEDQSVEVTVTSARFETILWRVQPAEAPRALRIEVTTHEKQASLDWSAFKLFRIDPQSNKRTPVKLRSAAHGSSLPGTETEKIIDDDRRSRADLRLKPKEPVFAVFEIDPKIDATSPLELEVGIERTAGTSRWRLWTTQAEPTQLVPNSIRALAAKDPATRSSKETEQLRTAALSLRQDHRQLSDSLKALQAKFKSLDESISTTLVMEELKEPRPTFVLMRGAYDKPGQSVTAQTPTTLPPMAPDLPKTRLGLARWLVDPANPLPARVTVNRFWQAIFGTGLVASSGDFGAQGDWPSHPELLDWLANEFIHSGWNIKSLVRLLVTSATYRQSSKAPPDLRERDPENRLLARGPRFRLQAEFVRDQALAASGLLVRKIGGPSVKPYHPPGLYEQITAGGYDRYEAGKGEDLYRRSLYTYWKRSVPNPSMLVFDAPFRETCTVKRSRTNTPLQALNLLNDPTYLEASRAVAERMFAEAAASPQSRLAHGFRLLLGRSPKPSELMLLQNSLTHHLAHFKENPQAAKDLLSIGEHRSPESLPADELAAYTSVASAILNSDEWIHKE